MQTGDKVLGRRFNCDIWEEFIFLYYRKDGNPVVTREHDWNICSSCSCLFCVQYIKPLPVYEERVLDPIRMMEWLVDHKWAVSPSGIWYNSEYSTVFTPAMWVHCGKRVILYYEYLPQWIEKVEI